MEADVSAADVLEPLPAGRWPDDPVDDARLLASLEASLLGRATTPPHVSRYRLGDRLGAGGFGVVFSAFDPELEREVAIKLVDATAADDAAAKAKRREVSNEARALARVQHPNVVVVHDVGTYEIAAPGEGGDRELRGVFIVMERIDGPSLADWLAVARSRREIIDAFLAAGRGLAAAHAAGLVHRDFKANNVLIDASGQPRVVDFGLARANTEVADVPPRRGRDATVACDRLMTRDGLVAGTPSHMAPEQLMLGTVDARADQYAFCVALYTALCGELPFRGDSIEALVRAKLRGIDPYETRRRLPRGLARVLERGLAPDPARRHPSLDALLRELDKAQRGSTRWRWSAAGVAAVAAIAAVTIGDTSPAAIACADTEVLAEWNADAASALHDALVAADATLGEDAWSRVQPRLDLWAERWRDTRAESCRATMVSRETTPEQMGVRMLCLDRSARAFRAVVRVLSTAELASLRNTPEIAAQLPDPGACLLETEVTEVGRQELALALEERLVEAKAHEIAGHEAEARKKFRAVADEANAAGLAELEVMALVGIAIVNRELPEAEQAAWRALEVAEGLDDEALAITAGIAVIEVEWSLRKLEQAERIAQIVDAKLRRRDIADLLPAKFAFALGSLRYGQGRAVEARVALRRAIELRSALLGADDLGLAEIYTLLGHVEYDASEARAAEEAYTRAHAIRSAVLEPGHRALARDRSNLGRAARMAGRYAEASSQFAAAIESAARRGAGPESFEGSIYRLNAGVLAVDMGRAVLATAILEQVLAHRTRTLGPEHERTARAEESLAEALIARGEGKRSAQYVAHSLEVRRRQAPRGHVDRVRAGALLAAAHRISGDGAASLAVADEALAEVDAGIGRASIDGAKLLRERALALEATGRLDEARGEMTAAIAVLDERWPPRHPGLAAFEADLARLERARDPARAATLRRDAIARLQEAALFDHPLLGELQMASGGTR